MTYWIFQQHLTAQSPSPWLQQIQKGIQPLVTSPYTGIGEVPLITLAAGIELAPTVNQVREHPYPLNGTVTDSDLAGLSINGRPSRGAAGYGG